MKVFIVVFRNIQKVYADDIKLSHHIYSIRLLALQEAFSFSLIKACGMKISTSVPCSGNGYGFSSCRVCILYIIMTHWSHWTNLADNITARDVENN